MFSFRDKSKKDKSNTSEKDEFAGGEAPECLPPYLDARFYDPIERDTEDAVAHGAESSVGRTISGDRGQSLTPSRSGSSLFSFGSGTSGLTSPFKSDSSGRGFVPNLNNLSLLNSPNSSNAITKENRNRYIMCKPLQDLPMLRNSIQRHGNEECHQVDRDEWVASNVVAIYQNLNIIYLCLKNLYKQSEWSNTMSAPTPPYKRKGKATDSIDSHVIPWTHAPRTGGSSKKYNTHHGAAAYIEVAMDEIKRYLADENDFPTRWGDSFPNDFPIITKRILQLCLNVFCHFYTRHVFFKLRENNLHTRLNKVFSHALLLDELFKFDIVNRTTHPLADLIPVLIDD